MPDERDWTIEFYVDVHGQSPVEEFLDSLDEKTRRTPRGEIETARERQAAFLERERGGA